MINANKINSPDISELEKEIRNCKDDTKVELCSIGGVLAIGTAGYINALINYQDTSYALKVTGILSWMPLIPLLGTYIEYRKLKKQMLYQN